MKRFLGHPPQHLCPGLHAYILPSPLEGEGTCDSALKLCNLARRWNVTAEIRLFIEASVLLSYCSSGQLDEIHGHVGESHTARNFRNFGQPLGDEAAKKWMLSVLQLQGNEFCPRTRSLEAHCFAGEPPHEWASSVVNMKNLPAMQSSFPREYSPGEGNDNPLQYSCLGNPMDRGVSQATIHGVAKESDITAQVQMRIQLWQTLVTACWTPSMGISWANSQTPDFPELITYAAT